MNTLYKNLLIIGIVFLIPLYVHAEISRTLSVGSRGIDVKELQVILNRDPDTRIAYSGAGSPGNESTYFGSLTRVAVEKFQIKYALEALTPAGLSGPTGVVGYYTRAVLYRLSRDSEVLPLSQSSVTPVVITAVTPSIVRSNPQMVTIYATGLTQQNTIVIASDGDQGVGTYPAINGTVTFPFTFTTGEKMKSQLAQYRTSASYGAIVDAFVANLTGETVSRSNGVTYVRAILKIKNENGESNAVPISIDIKSLLK